MMTKKEPQSREDLFKLIQAKKYSEVIEFLKTEPKEITQDQIVKPVLGHFFQELITAGNLSGDKDFLFSQLFNLHTAKIPFYTFSEEHFEIIVLFLCENAKKLDEANFYASRLPHNPVCAKIIEDFNESRPKAVSHEQSDTIRVDSVITNEVNLTKSIFNSKQERLFFTALRNCFPMHFIYPNIALSTILNISHIEGQLNPVEKKFFFNTTIDFIIVDQFDDFRPVVAIELDSEWHRLHNQGDRDDAKNKIIKLAGLPLYRIEHLSKFKTLEEFEKVILSTVSIKPRNV